MICFWTCSLRSSCRLPRTSTVLIACEWNGCIAETISRLGRWSFGGIQILSVSLLLFSVLLSSLRHNSHTTVHVSICICRSWVGPARQLDSYHFGHRQTQAKVILEAHNKLDLVDTLKTVLALTTFFDHLRSSNFKEAWTTLDSLSLLPTSLDQVDAKARAFDSYLAPLKDEVLLGATEALYQQFVHLKYSGVVTDATTVQSRLYDLQRRVRLVCSFAGRIGVRADCVAKMTKMEAEMPSLSG